MQTEADTVELLQETLAAQQRLLTLARDNGLAFYRPHAKQHEFHSAPNKRRGFFAGNRTGKSDGNGAETAAWAYGERTWYRYSFPIYGMSYNADGSARKRILTGLHTGDSPDGTTHPLVRQGIPPWPTKQLVVCANWNKVDEIWTSQAADRPGKIWKFLPKGCAKGYTNHAGVISEIHIASGPSKGAVINFMSVDAFRRDHLVAESSDYDRVTFDEPGPIALWKGLSRGLVDRQGQADFGLTALEEMWIYDKFNPDSSAEVADEDLRPFRDRFSVNATMYDNPHLTDQAIADFASDLTEDERSCRLNGHPLELSGLVYKEFRRDVHVLKSPPPGWADFHLPAKSCILHVRVDTHPVTPHAVTFAAVGPSEIPIVCYDFFKSCDADTLCEMINEYIKLTGCFLGSLKVEPAAWIPDPATKRAPIAAYFAKHNLPATKASKDMDSGILVTKSKLKGDKLPDGTTRPGVLFCPTARRTLWEFSRYRYDPATGRPVDENDHMMENLRRLLITPTRWFDPDRAAGFPITEEAMPNADLSPIQ